MSIKQLLGGVRYVLSPYRLAISYNGPLSHKLRFIKYAKAARNNGVAFMRIERVASELTEAFYSVKDMNTNDKSWFISQGYNPNRKAWYGMTKKNYKDYLSLFDFYNRQNYTYGDLTSLFDNKLSTFFLLQPFKEAMPFHYFFIRKGAIFPLQVEGKHNYKSEDILSLIEQKPIVFKRCHGGHGAGFIMAEKKDDSFYVNREKMARQDVISLINGLDDYIVTDYIIPCLEIRKIVGSGAYAVLRVLTVYDDVDGPQVIAMMVRLGSKKAGLTQAEHDYIYVGVDIDSGKMYDPIYEISDYEYRHITIHPDTKEVIEGAVVPNISQLRELVKNVSGHLSVTPYLCFDIIPSDNGFIILEINSHGQAFTVEPYYKVKTNKYFKKVLISTH